MLWIKTLHLLFVISWFAGLFYLPRIFVNLAMVDRQQQPDTYARLCLMARKLVRFMTPLAVLALLFGSVLWLHYGIGLGGGQAWMHAKLALVLVLLAYHHVCARMLKQFELGTNQRSHVWYRWYNEVPVIILLVVLILVVVKPF